MDIVLSIGLNVGGSEPPRQLSDTLQFVMLDIPSARILNLAMHTSEWEGVPERSLQVRLDLPSDPRRFQFSPWILTQRLHQECIAVLRPGADWWELHYADGRMAVGGTIEEYPALV